MTLGLFSTLKIEMIDPCMPLPINDFTVNNLETFPFLGTMISISTWGPNISTVTKKGWSKLTGNKILLI